ncbi:MAG: hypothetical protein NUV46_04080 [Nanoarchaeota archaeon]|nr:hypothetical protein [Nanoarchaeota archaeon]
MKRKTLYFLFGIVVVFVVVFLAGSGSGKSLEDFDEKMSIYKSSSCGCCEVYFQYFKGKGNSNVNMVAVTDNKKIMDKYEIPGFLESCHTTIVGDYFVEGHVPLEAIEKMLTENPDIAGIGMPGMPNGSPGMPGAKKGDFVIYGVNHDRSLFEFMRI